MKTFGISLLLLFLALPGNAQNDAKLQTAIYHFERGDYFQALYDYGAHQNTNPNDKRSLLGLANTNRMLQNFIDAEKWYAKLFELESEKTAFQFYYALTLLKNNQKNKGLEVLEAYRKENPEDQRVKHFLGSPKDVEINQGVFCLQHLPNNGLVEIRGKVIDKFLQKPISNATVKVYDRGIFIGKSTSDADGNFSTPVFMEGQYEVVVECEGYEPFRFEQNAAHSSAVMPIQMVVSLDFKFVGIALDQNNKGVKSLVVRSMNTCTGEEEIAVSDANGKFSLFLNTNCNVRLTMKHPQFAMQEAILEEYRTAETDVTSAIFKLQAR